MISSSLSLQLVDQVNQVSKWELLLIQNSVIWKYKFSSHTNSDDQNISNSLYSKAKQTIYSLTTFSSSNQAILFLINDSGGNLNSILYKFNKSITDSWGMILNNDGLNFVLMASTTYYLVLFNTISYSSTSYTFTNPAIYGIGQTLDLSRYNSI